MAYLPVSFIRAYLSHVYTVPRIFSPRNRLKAICLKRTSIAFLAILVNRARKALLRALHNYIKPGLGRLYKFNE